MSQVTNILGWLIVGALAGWIASLVMKTNAQQGLLMDIVVGIIGGIIGGYVFGLLGISTSNTLIWSLVTAVVGAIILLGVVKMFTKSS